MRPILICGGAGFIGTNLAHRLLSDGHSVTVLDSLARPGVEQNLRWLRDTHTDRLLVQIADIRDVKAVREAVRSAGQVYHFAAQVAVTTSLDDPLDDFEVNARGTLTLLEAIRAQASPPPLVFTSTNKVYGALEDLPLRRLRRRYVPADAALAARGVSEARPLDFHSPYGCSKGCADQYVLDYARTFGVPAVVFRMSCIYGPHQHGTEDQGWVAHFLIRALAGLPITIYGDGRQVRDLLFVDDLVEALLLAQRQMPSHAGLAFNIGGGPANAVSLLEVMDIVAEQIGKPLLMEFDGWRVGDQRYYVSDTGRFHRATGWRPTVSVREGVARLGAWLRQDTRPPVLVERAASGRR
jgi:CDP-paratose 2-epimerase